MRMRKTYLRRKYRTISRKRSTSNRQPFRVYGQMARSRRYKPARYSRIPKPVRSGLNKTAIRQLIKQNEDYCWVYADSVLANTQNTDNMRTVIGDIPFLMTYDAQQLFALLPLPANGSGNFSLILKSGLHNLTFSNFDNQAVDCKVFIVMAKRDVPFTNASSPLRPAIAWHSGVEGSLYGNVNPNAPAWGAVNPGSHPTDSMLFQRSWQIIKTHKFQLLPGGTKDIAYTALNLPYKVYNGYEAQTTTPYGFQGITMGVMWQLRGVPYLNTTSTYTPVFSSVNVGIMDIKRVHFTYAADSSKNLSYTTNWVAPVSVNNQSFVNPLSGAQSLTIPSTVIVNTNVAPVPVNVTNTAVTVQGTGSLGAQYVLTHNV